MSVTVEEMQEYLDRQLVCGLRIGDWVQVKRIADDFEGGWQLTWNNDMDKCVGLIGLLVDITKDGITVYFKSLERLWRFPYFVLEQTREPVDAIRVCQSRDGKVCDVFSFIEYGEYKCLGVVYGCSISIPYERNDSFRISCLPTNRQ